MLCTGSKGDSHIWDVATGAVVHVLKGHTDSVNSVAWSCGGVVATGSADGTVRLWEAVTGAAGHVLHGHKMCCSVAFNPNGSVLVSCGIKQRSSPAAYGDVVLWRVDTGTVAHTLHGLCGVLHTVSWNPARTTVATGTQDRTVQVRNVASGAVVRVIEFRVGVMSTAWSPLWGAAVHSHEGRAGTCS